MITPEVFKKVFQVMMDTKCKKITSIEQFQSWYDLLCGYPVEKVKLAMMIYIKSVDEFPTVGKIIDLIENPEDIELKAEEAWVKLCTLMDAGERVVGKIMKSFIDGYGGQTEYKLQQDKRANMITLKRNFIRFYMLRKKEIIRCDNLIAAQKTLKVITDGK